jgi:DNA repair exonuclease SbcCD ATPase subunit
MALIDGNLPAPGSGRVTHILHISDLHIRTGDIDKSRYKEYEIVTERLLSCFQQLPCVQNQCAVVLITGDVFHHKLRIESAGIKLFRGFIHRLEKLAPVILIRGNHDYRQDFPDEPDMIEALLESHSYQHVSYLNKTGCYRIANSDVGFGLVTVQDTLAAGSMAGRRQNLPSFPTTKALREVGVKHAIAIYHGMVQHAKCGGSQQGVPLNWFDADYDMIMMGDVHLQQVHRIYKKDMNSNADPMQEPKAFKLDEYCWKTGTDSYVKPWGYSGSLVQQNHGEPILGHGFFSWNLQDHSMASYHVHNDYGFATLQFDSRKEDWLIQMMDRSNTKHWQPLSSVARNSWFPKYLHARVLVPNIIERQEIKTQYLEQLKQHCPSEFLSLIWIVCNNEPNHHEDTSSNTMLESETNNDHVEANNQPSVWLDYVCEAEASEPDFRDEIAPWFDGIRHCEMKVPWAEGVAENDARLKTFSLKWRERNSRIDKKIRDLDTEMDHVRTSRNNAAAKKSLKLLRAEWQYIYCFLDQCHFDFQSVDHKISCINAKNGRGKTSFLEILCIGLFGEGFPSRTVGQNHLMSKTKSIISDCMPEDKTAWICIEFGILNTTTHTTESYRIKRSFHPELAKCRASLHHVQSNTLVHQGRPAVNAWISAHIGRVDDFLLACMMTQNSDRDFFSMKPNDQRELIDTVLHMNAPAAFTELCKEARLAHAFLIELLESIQDASRASHPDAPSRLQEIQTEHQSLITEQLAVSEEETTLLKRQSLLQHELLSADRDILNKGRTWIEETMMNLETTILSGTFENRSEDDEAAMLEAMQLELATLKKDNTHRPLVVKEDPCLQTLEMLKNDMQQAMAEEMFNIDDIAESLRKQEAWLQANRIPQCGISYDFTLDDVCQAEANLLSVRQEYETVKTDYIATLTQITDAEHDLMQLRDMYERHLVNQAPNVNGPNKSEVLEIRTQLNQLIDKYGSFDVLLEEIETVNAELQACINCIGDGQLEQQIVVYETQIQEWMDQQALVDNFKASAFHDDLPQLVLEAAKKYTQLIDTAGILAAERSDQQNRYQVANRTKKLVQLITASIEGENLTALSQLSKALDDIKDHPAEFAHTILLRQHCDLDSRISEVKERIHSCRALIEKKEKLWHEKDRLQSDERLWKDLNEKEVAHSVQAEQATKHLLWKHDIQKFQHQIRTGESSIHHLKSRANDAHDKSQSLQTICDRLESFCKEYKDRTMQITRMKHIACLHERIKQIEDNLRIHELTQKIKKLAEQKNIKMELQKLEKALHQSDAYSEHQTIEKALILARQRSNNISVSVAVTLKESTELAAFVQYDTLLTSWLKQLTQRALLLEQVHERMQKYKTWAYERRILPMLRTRVNHLLAMMYGAGLSLEVEWSDAHGTFFWMLRCGDHCPPIEKASGFQRFMASLSMRIALGQLGVLSCRQLFVDEGFTACDTDNLSNAPMFLRNLLGLYDHVMLVSHLDELKDNIDMSIRIMDGRLQYGNHVAELYD